MDSGFNQKDWNGLVIKNPNTFFQSWEWGELQKELGRNVFRLIDNDVPLHLYEYDLPLGRSYLYSPGLWFRGEFNDVLRDKIRGLSKRAIFAKLEPLLNGASLSGKGIVKGETVQPNHIGIIELKKGKEAVYSSFEHDTRYAIRTAEKRGVSVECISEFKEKKDRFEDFWSVYRELNDRKSLKTFPKRYYELVSQLNGDCRTKIFIARVDGKPINVALVIYFGKTSYYQFAASKTGYGKYNAPSLTLWKIIEDSIDQDMDELNLGGMYWNDKAKRGLTQFKKSFGAVEAILPGAFDMPINESWYRLYDIVKKIRG